MSLTALKAVPGNLTPPFSANHYIYSTPEPDYHTTSVALFATPGAEDTTVHVSTDSGAATTCGAGCHNVTLDKCGDGPGVPPPTEVLVELGTSVGTETYRLAVGCTLPPPTVSMLAFTPGLLSPPFAPDVRNYTLTLPNSSISEVSVATTYPMTTGRVSVTADGVAATGGASSSGTNIAIVTLAADSVNVLASAGYGAH
eukprot:SAG11_NODE_2998_length_2779_cov_1.738060_2_plen_199_part_00